MFDIEKIRERIRGVTKRFEIKIYSTHITRADLEWNVMPPHIYCKGSEDEELYLFFHIDKENIPPNSSICEEGKTLGIVHLPLEQYNSCLDVIRNLKPIEAYIYKENPDFNALHYSEF